MPATKTWIRVCQLEDIPVRGARVIRTESGRIALFRTAEQEVFALDDKCPHKSGPLSQGIVHGNSVTCPLHNWVISLETGKAPGKPSLLDERQRAALFQIVEAGPNPAIHGVVRWRIVDLIQWVWEAASRSRLTEQVVVATDDDRIAEPVRGVGQVAEVRNALPQHDRGQADDHLVDQIQI